MTTKQQIMRLETDSQSSQALKITKPSAQRTRLPRLAKSNQLHVIETRAILFSASRLQPRHTSNGCRSAPAQEPWALLTWQASPKSSNGAPWLQLLPLILASPTVQWLQHLPAPVSQWHSLSSYHIFKSLSHLLFVPLSMDRLGCLLPLCHRKYRYLTVHEPVEHFLCGDDGSRR
jgi:hypothetical protein